jgi:hypothetical protein
MWNFRLSQPTGLPERVAETAPRPLPGPAVVPAVATMNDEIALAELEAVATPRYEALRAYDAFTPRVADYVQVR